MLTVPASGADLAVGDVIAFHPPAPFVVPGAHPVLHRVAQLGVHDGQPLLTTKGDANPAADPWRVATRHADVGRAILVVPYLGRILAGGTPTALACVLGGAALLAGLNALRPQRGDTGPRRTPTTSGLAHRQ